MNSRVWMALSFLMYWSCAEKRIPASQSAENLQNTCLNVPNVTIPELKLFYDNQASLWTFNGQLFSGYAVSFYPDSTLRSRFGVLNGRKQCQSIVWYTDGCYQRMANYHKGKLHGDKRVWGSDSAHTLLSHLKYHSGKPHGEQKKWYPTGELFKVLNLNMGKEEGLQQAFRKNGDLYANYEAKNGRIFGLKKAALCYSLENESMPSEK